MNWAGILAGILVAALVVGLLVAFFRWEIPRWKLGWQVKMTLIQMAAEKMAQDQTAPKPPPIVSPDGLWSWDGERWQLQQRPPQGPPA